MKPSPGRFGLMAPLTEGSRLKAPSLGARSQSKEDSKQGRVTFIKTEDLWK